MKQVDLIKRIDKLQEKENKVTVRLKRLLHIVNHSLNYRKHSYLELKDQYTKLINNRQETFTKIKTLERNIVIYKNNIKKIDIFLKENQALAVDTKIKYDSLLTGPVSDVIECAGESFIDKTINNPDDENAYMLLKLKKQSLINSMDIVFKQYEKEIDEIKMEKNNVIDKRAEITEKLEMAQNQNTLLLNDIKSYKNEINIVIKLIKTRSMELNAVVSIYKGILKKIQLSSTVKKERRPALTKGILTY